MSSHVTGFVSSTSVSASQPVSGSGCLLQRQAREHQSDHGNPARKRLWVPARPARMEGGISLAPSRFPRRKPQSPLREFAAARRST